jgi:hypothetical protein
MRRLISAVVSVTQRSTLSCAEAAPIAATAMTAAITGRKTMQDPQNPPPGWFR